VNSDGTFEIDTINRLTSVGGEARPHFDAMAAHARDIREDGRGREERRTRFARSELHLDVVSVNLLLDCFAAVFTSGFGRVVAYVRWKVAYQAVNSRILCLRCRPPSKQGSLVQ